MNTKRSKPGAFRRCLIVLPALIVGVSLAFTTAASAQVSFQASVKGNIPPPRGCPTADFCGNASIAGYGPAAYTVHVTSTTPVSSGKCPAPARTGLVSLFTYTATTTFTLLSDGSALVLDENGLVCVPANSSLHAPVQSRGFPWYASNSNWTVEPVSTGQFSGLTGSGTDAGDHAGAKLSVTYSGTLDP